MFSAKDGQWQLVQQCLSRRLIMVAFNRGHRFGSIEAVKAELSPQVLELAPLTSRWV